MGFIPQDLLFRIPALLVAITFHEYAHARMALAWGDPTAKMQGRLTLNPISHLDPIGALMVILVGFGWARPVPVNPYNFHDQNKGMFWVSLAGPGANLIIALAGTLFLVFSVSSGLLLQDSTGLIQGTMNWIVIINVYLAIFNMVPLPPLDGSKILSSLLPRSYQQYFQAIEAYAPFILILLLITVLPSILRPIASLILGIFEILAQVLAGIFF